MSLPRGGSMSCRRWRIPVHLRPSAAPDAPTKTSSVLSRCRRPGRAAPWASSVSWVRRARLLKQSIVFKGHADLHRRIDRKEKLQPS